MKKCSHPVLVLALMCMVACGDTGTRKGNSGENSRGADREAERETAGKADRQGGAGTLRLHPENNHYLEYRGKPLILVTSAEHYGALVNKDFDEMAYLEALAGEGFNYTRIFTGTYIEPVDNIFGIRENTLAPPPGRYLSPWVQEEGKYDLDRFNPEYFSRLRAFVSRAEALGIMVEVTLFSSIYDQSAWELLPFNVHNNVNGAGHMDLRFVHTLYHGELGAYQEKFIRKMVRELNEYDNIFFEIQNEPWADHPNLAAIVNLDDENVFNRSWQKRVEVANDVSADWQAWVAGVIGDEESSMQKKHLIAQNISNFQYDIQDPPAGISIFNFHYAHPDAVRLNTGLQGVIGLDETGFMPQDDLLYVTQAWRFILSGGGLYNNLDYSFTAGHERGDWPIPASNPGWGGRDFREKLSILARTMTEVPFHEMEYSGTLVSAESEDLIQYGLHNRSGTCIVYLENCRGVTLRPAVPGGEYMVTWLDIYSGVRMESRKSLDKHTPLLFPYPADQGVLLIKPSPEQ